MVFNNEKCFGLSKWKAADDVIRYISLLVKETATKL